ncbi:MAG: DNA-processing protein DprA [Bacteroidales bacterium]
MNPNENKGWWLSFAHTRGISASRKMDLLIRFVHGDQLSLPDALEMVYRDASDPFLLTEKEREAIGRMLFEGSMRGAEALHLEQTGVQLITVMEPAYPPILKRLLKKNAPALLYMRGNSQLLQLTTLGVEGVRDASPLSLRFTETVIRGAVARGETIVAGVINPVEKKALDTALAIGGNAAVILAEGINLFKMPEYERSIAEGRLVLVSVFPASEERTLRTTMDRNMLLYDFCTHVFMAQSSAIGGSWDGAVNRLAKQPLYVRVESRGEENFNNLLIANGGIAVDEYGVPGDFGPLQEYMHALPDNPDLPFDTEHPHTAAEYVAFLRNRLAKMQTLCLSDFFKENHLPDRIRWQLENIFNFSPDIEKVRVGNKNVYSFKGAIPKQGSLF